MDVMRDCFRPVWRAVWRLRSRVQHTLVKPHSYGIRLGAGSVIGPPRVINGAEYIRVGDRTCISSDAWLSAYDQYAGVRYTPSLVIGDDVYIGGYACITCITSVVIGDGCVLSEFVYISDHRHGFDPGQGLIRYQPLVSRGEVQVGPHTFLGYQVCVLPGVTLGEHCVVGANSVVTHSFPAYSMVAGAPARLIKSYSREAGAWIPIHDRPRTEPDGL